LFVSRSDVGPTAVRLYLGVRRSSGKSLQAFARCTSCHLSLGDQNTERRKTRFTSRINQIAIAKRCHRNISLSFLQKLCSLVRIPPGKRGVSRSSRHAGGMRWTRHVAACVLRADERHGADGEVVWSWHPGADAKSAMVRSTHGADDGGKRAGPRGEREGHR
jgi:hypothetical protein